MTADLPDWAADRERETRRGTWVEITDECNGSDCDGCGECWTPDPAALAARPAPDDGESVDLTPGVVWTDAQLAVVRDLTARAFRAEQAVERVRALAEELASHRGGHDADVADVIRRALEGPQSPPSDRRRAEGGGRMYLGESRSGVTSRDETSEL